jgi:precorrin-6A synthase
MRKVLVVGIGAGGVDQLTVEAVHALNAADVVFEIERGASELTVIREQIRVRHVERQQRVVQVAEPQRDRAADDYERAVEQWRGARANAWEAAIRDGMTEQESGAFMVWGDPSLYDSTIAVLDDLLASGTVAFSYEVIPGVSSIHALTARHGIALNRVAGAVLITTGRRLAAHGFPDGVDDVVVMLDAGGSFRAVIDEPCDIYWGAYLGTPDELLISGPLAQVADEIDRVRAAARERKGWIMDSYLLRRD